MNQTETKGYSYCTFFDSHYLTRGLALIESLRNHGDSHEILVLCLDAETEAFFKPLVLSLNLSLTALDELTAEYPELEFAKLDRSLIEFYFTCSPFVLKLSQKNKPAGHLSIYLDADLYFFDDPHGVVREIGDSSVAIIEHNYPWFLKALAEKYGKYNVGLVGFRNNQEGSKTLDWWAEKCINWCHDYPEDGKYADQGYLSSFSELSPNLSVLAIRSFNLAPWNTAATPVRLYKEKVLVGNSQLNFFHFHGLKKAGSFWVSSQLNYLSPLPRSIFKKIYEPYIRHLEEIEKRISVSGNSSNLLKRMSPGFRGLLANAARAIFAGLSLVLGQSLPEGQRQIRN
jgi:hypothetical protein